MVEENRSKAVKIQLYVTNALNGGFSIIRYKDGVYDRIPTGAKDCQDVKGYPVDQNWARTINKEPLLAEANRKLYGISEDAEIYKEEQK